MKSNPNKIMTIAVLWFQLYLHVKLENQHTCWLGNGPEDDHYQRISHRGSLLKGVAVQGVLYQSILNAKLTGRKKLGRKKRTSNRDERKLENTVNQSWFKHFGELHKEWTEAGVRASRVTMLIFRKRATKPLLKQKHHQKHLTWAKEKKNWTVAQWSKVLFSDKDTFCISFGNQGHRVWRKSGEAQNPCCLKSSVTFLKSVMIWGAVTSAGVGQLCFIKSNVNAAIYQEILEHFILPSADKLYRYGYFEILDFLFILNL